MDANIVLDEQYDLNFFKIIYHNAILAIRKVCRKELLASHDSFLRTKITDRALKYY